MGLLTPAALAHRLPLRSGAVQLCFTSPPYYQQRAYGAKGSECPTGAAWLDWPAVRYSPMPGLAEIEVEPWRGQLGHEPAVEMYVGHLVYCFREVRRTLHRSGVLWANLGDKMAASGDSGGGRQGSSPGISALANRGAKGGSWRSEPSVQAGNLLQVPARFALAMQADGWILRSDVIWEANRLPESVAGCRWERCRVKVAPGASATLDPEFATGRFKTHGVTIGDAVQAIWEPCPGCPKCEATGGLVLRRGSWRPTNVVEHVFMFAKTADYWASGEAVREEGSFSWGGWQARAARGEHLHGDATSASAVAVSNHGRNLRNVWRINTEPSSEQHYAGFPTGLVRPALLSSTPEAGVCRECGEPWSEVIERQSAPPEVFSNRSRPVDGLISGSRVGGEYLGAGAVLQAWRNCNPPASCGWLPSCTCLAVPDPLTAAEARKLTRPALVLDCFGGTGTTAKVARFHGRRAVTVDPILAYSLIARDKAGEACAEARAARPKKFSVSGPLFGTSGR